MFRAKGRMRIRLPVYLFIICVFYHVYFFMKPETNNIGKSVENNILGCPKKPFLRVQEIGRLGNQIYIWANARGFCETRNCFPVIDNVMFSRMKTYFPGLTGMNLSSASSCNRTYKVMPDYEVLERKMNITAALNKDVYLNDFPFRTDFFTSVDSIIRKELTLNQEIMTRVRDKFEELRKEHRAEIFVGVHIRQTDFKEYMKEHFGITTMDSHSYVNKAINMYDKFLKSPIFLILSDDIEWCRKNIGVNKTNIIYPGNETDVMFDFALLSSSNHSVYTFGTFGFFSSYLAGGNVIYPYYREYKSLPENKLTSEMAIVRRADLKNWIPLDANI